MLKSVNAPVFESPKSTESSIEPPASSSKPLPENVQLASRVNSVLTASANKEATQKSSKRELICQVTSNEQKAGSNLGSLRRSIHSVEPSTQVDTSEKPPLPPKPEPATSSHPMSHVDINSVPSKSTSSTISKEVRETGPQPGSLEQSIHADPKPWPSNVNPKIIQTGDSKLNSSERSTPTPPPKPKQRSVTAASSGIFSSRFAKP